MAVLTVNGCSDKAGGGVVHPPLPKLKKNTSEQTIQNPDVNGYKKPKTVMASQILFLGDLTNQNLDLSTSRMGSA